MAEPWSPWSSVPLSDSSVVKLVGDWSTDVQSGYHNVSYPETPTSVSFTFNGNGARAVGFVTLNASPLHGWITLVSGEPFGHLIELPAYNSPIGDGSPNSGDTTGLPAFYTTETLSCGQHTLNFTIMPDQVMQLKEFDFVRCTSSDDQPSASATASTSAFSQNSVIATEKKQTLGAGVIVGAFLGALAVLLALGSLAFFIILRRRRRNRIGSLPSPPPSPFLSSISCSRSSRQFEPSTPSVPFLASVSSPPSSAAIPGDGSGGAGGRTGQGRSTTMLDASAAKSRSVFASAAPATIGLSAPMLPLLFARSAAYYPSDGDARNGQQNTRDETAIKKQDLRHDDAGLEPDGLIFAHGYLPDSKELMAWQEWEQADAQGCARTSRTMEALPQYQARGSLQL